MNVLISYNMKCKTKKIYGYAYTGLNFSERLVMIPKPSFTCKVRLTILTEPDKPF